jgi:hypothetical protein
MGFLYNVADGVVTGGSVMIGIYVLSVLDSMPMSHLHDLGIKDVKFYCPPHAAIALILFSRATVEGLRSTLIGIFVSIMGTILMTQYGRDAIIQMGGDDMLVRSFAAGGAALFMKVCSVWFPPAGALAVLFVDNAAMKGLGMHYAFMPGLSGTIVLFILAYIKVILWRLVKPIFVAASKDEDKAKKA